jgi:ribosomal 30S subunit maturation factor RimM
MEDAGASELVVIARAIKPRGLRGEIVAELLTDFPDRFEELEELIVVSPVGERTIKRLEDYWFQNDRVVLKLAGYDDVDSAKEWLDLSSLFPSLSVFRFQRIITTIGNSKDARSRSAPRVSARSSPC